MADIIMPKKPPGMNMQAIGQIAGAVLGAAGGPAGMATGAGLGGMAGGILGGAQKEALAPVESAMSRRMQQIDNSPLNQIRDSIDSLQYIKDPAQQAALAGPLMQAKAMAAKKPGVY